MQVPRYLIAAPLILLVLQAQAQSPDTSAEDFFEETPLILTASRMSKPLLESPASVTIIDRHLIEMSGVREIPDLFRLVPGFVVGYHSGHAPAVSYQGMGQEFARHSQVLIDGRSVFIPSFGGVPWSNLPLLIEDIERIEIIRGPNAVTYGANAFISTINIITRNAAEDRGTQYTLTVGDNSNPDIKDASLRIGRQHEAFDWRLSLGAISDAGFNQINDSKNIGKMNFRMDLQSRNNQYWTIQFGASDSTAGRGMPQSADNQTDIERDEEATNRYINIRWEGIWDSGTTIARLTNTRQEVTDNYDPGPFDFNGFPGVTTYIDFDRISDRTDFELVQSDDVGNNLRLVYGAGLRQDKVKSLYLFNQTSFQSVDTNRVFGELEWRINQNWLLDVGVMVEDSSLTGQEQSPRISLVRKLGNRHALRFVASAAKRNPILVENEGESEFVADVPPFGSVVVPILVGNDSLEPEDIKSYEIGLRSQYDNGLGSDIKIFSYKITDHIVNSTTPVDAGPLLGVLDVVTVINAESTRVKGIEFALNYSPATQFEFYTGASLVDVESSDENIQDSFPDYTAFVSGHYQINDRHLISASLYYLDNISWLDSQRETPLARRLDIRYSYQFNNQTRVEIIGQNLLEDFEDYEPENVHDQVVYLRLSGGF